MGKPTRFDGGVDTDVLSIDGAPITSTPAELNKLDGFTGSAAELNAAATGQVGVASHNYGGAAADWALSAAEQRASRLIVTNANGACAAIATPTAGKLYFILNTSGQALTIKATGQTGVTIASTKSAIVVGNGTDFVRVTTDA